MASSPNPNPTLFLLFFYLLFTVSAARFSTADNHLIACGAAAPAVLPDGRRFLPDSICAAARLRSPAPTLPSTAPPSPPPPSPLHAAARVFSCPSFYELSVRRRGYHLLRLHFYPFDTLSAARFHVAGGGFVLLHNFTASSPVLKEFIIPVESERLVLSFIPASEEKGSFAFVNAIELVSAPDELVGDIGSLVKSDGVERLDGLSSQVFETLYRVSVGGPKVTPFNDTLWRTWVNDARFLIKTDSYANMVWHFGGRIAYPKNSKLMSREVAPDNVYNTARSVKSEGGNLTWGFLVTGGNRYLVRMHLCDILSKALFELYFNIYVNGYLAVKDFDISNAAGFLASPYYIDFVVDVEDEGLLTVAIGGSKNSRSTVANGFLNGLELMRMNKTAGGMDGDFPIVLDSEYFVRRGIWEFVRSLLCGLIFAGLLVALFALVLKFCAELRIATHRPSPPTDTGEVKLVKGYQLVTGKMDL